ncbi:MAG: hypothetical protein O2890_01540 [Cyanobacteria bacterium]|nr:hypothetical protein [Cyanobacteriota bacterium]MDA0865102.1 hypothetical protein [Cyanobacteriota bacterium]
MLLTDLTPETQDPIDCFKQGSADLRLATLHFLAQSLHQVSAQTLPTAFFSQLVQQVIRQVEQVPQDERVEVLRDMVSGANTRLAEAYDGLDINKKLAFWYRLVNTTDLMANAVQSLDTAHQWTLETHLRELAKRDINELVQVFKTAVAITDGAVSVPAWAG